MEPKHKRSSFGLYEMALLKENPYTHEVRARQISFTEELNESFGHGTKPVSTYQPFLRAWAMIRRFWGSRVCTALRQT